MATQPAKWRFYEHLRSPYSPSIVSRRQSVTPAFIWKTCRTCGALLPLTIYRILKSTYKASHIRSIRRGYLGERMTEAGHPSAERHTLRFLTTCTRWKIHKDVSSITEMRARNQNEARSSFVLGAATSATLKDYLDVQ